MKGYDRYVVISGTVFLFMIVITSLMFGANVGGDGGDRPVEKGYLEPLELKKETISNVGQLDEGIEDLITIAQTGKAIRNVSAVLTWVDESDRPGMPRLRRYENQPDTFELRTQPPVGNGSSQTAQNPVNSEGRIELSHSHTLDELYTMIDEARSSQNSTLPDWELAVKLVSAGNWVPVLPPKFIGYIDDSNSYILEVTIEYYDISGLMEG
ncbi:MAG: hypothetical protein QCI82_01655 [Candidatus Thermoplasmatota archaeon]|nr:hypothetical protein [Candidatus Thermoplasmatota archaeon]